MENTARMSNAEIVESIKKKSFLLNSFLYSMSLPPGENQESGMRHATSAHYLKAVVLELLVKMLIELDHREPAPYTHDIHSLFAALGRETRQIFEEAYDEARKRTQKLVSTIPQAKEAIFPPLEEVLRINEDTVIDYRYDAPSVKANAAFDPTFYHEMLKYIAQRVEALNATKG